MRRSSDSTETPRVEWHGVQIASLSDGAASIIGNLKAGDHVVALGARLLHEGEQVRVAAGQGGASEAAANRLARQ
jgi:hypothetical protein